MGPRPWAPKTEPLTLAGALVSQRRRHRSVPQPLSPSVPPNMSASRDKGNSNLTPQVQDMTLRPMHIREKERSQLRTVMKKLSILKMLKGSDRRIRRLHSLAKSCWKSLLSVPKILCTASGTRISFVHKKPEEKDSKKPLPKAGEILPEDGEAGRLETEPAAAIQVPRVTPRPPGLDLAQARALQSWPWFKGLPQRVNLPAPRVLCRPSALRWVKRCCTRSCSASLEKPRSSRTQRYGYGPDSSFRK
uniref:TP53 target 5 n=2 Tax=Ornithorhynchus anatinus TaxID=9258 RepID=A0A6I8MXU9_ORNAN